MATLLTQLPPLAPAPSPPLARQRSQLSTAPRQSLLLASLLTPLALLIHGYHPFSEDGGVYIPAVERLLHPELFPQFTSFVTAPARHSAFALLVSSLARVAHLTSPDRLPIVLFVLHLATVWLTLLAAALLACRCWPGIHARAGAVLLLACWLGLPVAGTSLLFMDPYLTARSFSTPCMILALVAALAATDAAPSPGFGSPRSRARAAILWAAAILVAGALHPLMAAYALLASALVAACRLPGRIPKQNSRQLPGRVRRTLAVAAIAVLSFASALLIDRLASPDSSAYTRVALTRSYWFLSQWRWYELIGIAAPILILTLYLVLRPQRPPISTESVPSPSSALAGAAAAAGILVTLIAAVFARPAAASHTLAALQPMRGLQFVYLAMILLLGASLGNLILRSNRLAWLLAALCLGGPLCAAARVASPQTAHLELPGVSPRNDWVNAFLWIRARTPAAAVFALPPNYINLPGEDAHGFRAITQRSALPDYSKDGGETAVAPALAPLWNFAQSAGRALPTESDAERRAALEPIGISWLVLPASSATQFECPFRNSAVKVCRLR